MVIEEPVGRPVMISAMKSRLADVGAGSGLLSFPFPFSGLAVGFGSPAAGFDFLFLGVEVATG